LVSCGESKGGNGDPTGEAAREALRLDFDRRLMLQLRGSAITSDAGLRPDREFAAGNAGLPDGRVASWNKPSTPSAMKRRLPALDESVRKRLFWALSGKAGGAVV